jgi:Rps23 Pro-64 3,4-dihydroxylase Tpa1-like proline 4-hydroxylase
MVHQTKKFKPNQFNLELNEAEKYRQQYSKSGPYRHCVLTKLFNDDLLRKVRKEILELQFTEKETDIYKVNQTGDLKNLDGLEKEELDKLSSLMELRNNLYSKDFRDFIRNVLNCGPIGQSIDLSINKYTKGCHLLNHDDVIGTRLVSYILYLPNPDEEWLPEFGGQLELYPVEIKGTPKNEPSKIVQPDFNTMVFFDVQPGHSFHSVEEVVADKERLSISGWFHHPLEGEEHFNPNRKEEETKSTLEQILGSISKNFEPFKEELGQELSSEERKYLSHFLNPQYLQEKVIQKVNEKFCEDSHIQLGVFLNKEIEGLIEDYVKGVDQQIQPGRMTPHGTGVGNGWRTVGPAHLQRFVVLEGSAVDEEIHQSNVLLKVQECFASSAFRKWLYMITSLESSQYRSQIRRFRPGLDYTLALSNPQPLLHCVLSLTPGHDDWESGELGGYASYLLPHNDQDAAVYNRTSEDGILLTTPPNWNQLELVVRDEGILHFIKYVSANAPSSRWDIDAEYTVVLDAEETEE